LATHTGRPNNRDLIFFSLKNKFTSGDSKTFLKHFIFEFWRNFASLKKKGCAVAAAAAAAGSRVDGFRV